MLSNLNSRNRRRANRHDNTTGGQAVRGDGPGGGAPSRAFDIFEILIEWSGKVNAFMATGMERNDALAATLLDGAASLSRGGDEEDMIEIARHLGIAQRLIMARVGKRAYESEWEARQGHGSGSVDPVGGPPETGEESK